MAKSTAVLADIIQRFQDRRAGLFADWARAQCGYPDTVWGHSDAALVEHLRAVYGAEVLDVLAKQGAAQIVLTDMAAVVGQSRADRIWSLSVTPHVEARTPDPRTDSRVGDERQKFSAVHYLGFAILGASIVWGLFAFWKVVLGILILLTFAGGFLLVCIRSTRIAGAGILASACVVVGIAGAVLPATESNEAGSVRPDLSAESRCSLALEEGTLGNASNFGEAVINNQMVGSRFSSESVLQVDGSYAVTIENKSEFTDSTCPISLVGRCIVNGDQVTVTSPLRRAGYIACG